jgi:hypothetical protein
VFAFACESETAGAQTIPLEPSPRFALPPKHL